MVSSQLACKKLSTIQQRDKEITYGHQAKAGFTTDHLHIRVMIIKVVSQLQSKDKSRTVQCRDLTVISSYTAENTNCIGASNESGLQQQRKLYSYNVVVNDLWTVIYGQHLNDILTISHAMVSTIRCLMYMQVCTQLNGIQSYK